MASGGHAESFRSSDPSASLIPMYVADKACVELESSIPSRILSTMASPVTSGTGGPSKEREGDLTPAWHETVPRGRRARKAAPDRCAFDDCGQQFPSPVMGDRSQVIEKERVKHEDRRDRRHWPNRFEGPSPFSARAATRSSPPARKAASTPLPVRGLRSPWPARPW